MQRPSVGVLKTLARRAAERSPRARYAALEARLACYEVGWPPGHFYSPLPDLDDVHRREDAIFGEPGATVPGVDLRDESQLALLSELGRLHGEQPWAADSRPGLRYRFDNPNFQEGEALTLFGLLRLMRPQRVVEVGCGWSSCALLDAVELFLGGNVRCTFVEPYPQLLRELVPDDELDIRAVRVQDVDTELFAELAAGDMLIIDSTHVAKVGSDVNHLMFDVLPRLAPGVLVHVHDIHYPFEYPRQWIYDGRAWNEAYLVRAFLQFNVGWEIVYFNSFIAARHADALRTALPPATRSPGSSLWLRRRSGDDTGSQ